MSVFQIALDLGPLHFSVIVKDDEEPEPERQRESQTDSIVERADQYDDNQVHIGFRP